MFAKIISKQWEEGRNICKVRNRNSQRIQDLRRSKRSAVLNQLRQVVIPKEKKKTAQEEKLERLKVYKAEKQKKMEDFKKTQRPPFHNIVKTRHTGSTPFREVPVRVKLLDKKLEPKKIVDTKEGKENKFGKKQAPGKSTVVASSSSNAKNQGNQFGKKQAPGKSTALALSSSNAKNPGNQFEPKKIVDTKEGKENKLGKKQAPGKSTAVASSSSNAKNPGNQFEPKKIVDAKEGKENKLGKKQAPGKSTVVASSSSNAMNQGNQFLTDVITTGVRTRRTARQIGKVINSSEPKEVTKHREGVQSEDTVKENTQETEIVVPIKSDKEESVIPATFSESFNDPKNGVGFHRQRLQRTIDRLCEVADSWENKKKDIPSEQVIDEVLAVIGQTRLLISKRLAKFKGLIDRCEFPRAEELTITLEDLDGYWEVMYQQVDQLDKKYDNLKDLESNNWQEKVVTVTKKPTKKEGTKKKAIKPVKSRFKEFLKLKQNDAEIPSATEIPVTPGGQSVRNEDTTQSSLYMSASKGEEMEFGCSSALENLRTPKRTPAFERVLRPSRRRSSAALITIKRSSFMKF